MRRCTCGGGRLASGYCTRCAPGCRAADETLLERMARIAREHGVAAVVCETDVRLELQYVDPDGRLGESFVFVDDMAGLRRELGY